MPIIRPGMKKPPPGFEVVNDRLEELEEKMKIAIQVESNGVVGRTTQSRRKRPREEDEEEEGEAPIPPLWQIALINHERTRYVYDCFVKERSIPLEVLKYCEEMHFIDGGLLRRWRLPGYEKLCCTACGTPGAAALASSTIARFSHRNKEEGKSTKAQSETAVCICRVPPEQRRDKSFYACSVCGCKGCASSSGVIEKS
ncbi:bud site selection protein 31 [Angomonas deanei]|nr:bud site selection protein 31 [Angomonas deanei]|eukprot:EPY30059.1 bud site selection protein 31 [Angomonas deanei]